MPGLKVFCPWNPSKPLVTPNLAKIKKALKLIQGRVLVRLKRLFVQSLGSTDNFENLVGNSSLSGFVIGQG